MAEPDSGQPGGIVGQPAHTLRENRCAAVRIAHDQMLWILVPPLQARVVAENPDP